MAVARIRFLESGEEDLIDQQSIECLETIGVKVKSELVLHLLKDAGADVDGKTQVVKMPEGMVREALANVPKDIVLHGRDSKHDMRIPVSSWPYVGTSGLATYIIDLETGEKRDSTVSDIADCVKVADALSGVDYVQTSLTATEVPRQTHGIHELWTALQNTTKHVQGIEIFDAEDARMQVELGALVAGGKDELDKKPHFTVIHCSIAPLMFEHDAVEAMVEFARAGVPITTMTMSLSGGTAPVTLAGTLVNANAENLASFVIGQAARKGARTIYCSSSTPVSMTTGMIHYQSANQPLIAAGLAQMARRYGIPCMVGDWGLNDTDVPGFPHTFSETMGIALSTMSGTDMMGGVGSLDNAKGMALEQEVIDSYVWENVRMQMTPFEISKTTAALDVIREVGHGNTFLTHIHTARNFKKEAIQRSADRGRFEATLSNAMVAEAKDIAAKLLKEHEVPPLEQALIRQGNELIRTYEKERTDRT
ncbi:MAG: trimethylamine methyltransferase family protein [Methanobacteriota archaeon]|nr:MAG: trimethylamine methyltransferase family protein [Euryarchaeota archaeon]